LQRCRAAGYLTLAAVAKCLQAATWLVARGNKNIRITFYHTFPAAATIYYESNPFLATALLKAKLYPKALPYFT